MSHHVVNCALGVATLTLAVCSSACVQTQDEHRPAAQALADLRASAEAGDAVAVRMTSTDLREAERRAQAWHEAHQGMRNRAAPPSDTVREGLIIALGSCHRANTGRLQSLIGRFGANLEASSAESTAAVQPPSLRLSLPAPAGATLPPVGPSDLQRLQPQESRPPVIGVRRRLPPGAITQSFSGGAVKTTAEGAWQSTAAGRLWRLKTTSPSARAMRIHFRDFAIGAGSLWLHSPSGQEACRPMGRE